MTNLYKSLGRSALFTLDAERAHGLSLAALGAGLHPHHDPAADPRLAVRVAGLDFPNPLGMAAGYDKNAEVPNALSALGFGHAEVGTVTPKPQKGNPKPRIFRLVKDRAIINRLGFNSGGHAMALANLKRRQPGGITGVNLGANKTSADFTADYVDGIMAFGEVADYFTINISSPNTPGLRNLQAADALADLLARIGKARAKAAADTGRRLPVFLKVAPDLDERGLDDIAAAVTDSDVDALIISNTTLARDGLRSSHRDQAGGLSGRPLLERSTIVLAKMRQRLGDAFPLIGVGGVHDARSALDKIEAGASLVQLYTGMIYEGPGLPAKILKGLSAMIDREEIASLDSVRGSRTGDWAGKT